MEEARVSDGSVTTQLTFALSDDPLEDLRELQNKSVIRALTLKCKAANLLIDQSQFSFVDLLRSKSSFRDSLLEYFE